MVERLVFPTLVIQKERLLHLQLVLFYAATEESQRGNDCGG